MIAHPLMLLLHRIDKIAERIQLHKYRPMRQFVLQTQYRGCWYVKAKKQFESFQPLYTLDRLTLFTFKKYLFSLHETLNHPIYPNNPARHPHKQVHSRKETGTRVPF